MDYVTHEMGFHLPASTYKCTTGTWTLTSSSGILYQLKTATDETAVVSIPIVIPFVRGEFGIKLKSIEIPLRITTADLDAVVAGSLYFVNSYKAVAAAGTNIDTTAVTITETGTSVTAAATDRLYTATVSSPDWVYSSTVTKGHYQLDLSLNAGATTVIRVYSGLAIADCIN